MLELDETDRKILHQLDLDCRQSIPRIAKKVGAKKDTVAFRIKRLVSRKIITKFITEVNTSKLGYIGMKGYFQFQNYTEEMEKEFFDYLGTFRQMGWIVSCTGRWDAMIVYWGKSAFEFHRSYLQILDKYSKYVVSKEIAQNMKWFWYNRKWLIGHDQNPVGYEHGGEPSTVKLDALDRAILSCLISDGRMPVVEIAKSVKTTPQNVINRMRRMKSEGVIAKFGIDINYKKLGIIFCKTFVYLQNVTEKKLEAIFAYCKRQPNVFALVNTLGPWDLELELEVENFEQVTMIMNGMRSHFGDTIRNYESVIVSKQTTVRHVEY